MPVVLLPLAGKSRRSRRRLAGAAHVAGLACLGLGIGIVQARAGGPDRIDLGIGATDVLRGNRPAVNFQAEYRSGFSLIPAIERYATLSPFAAIDVSARGSVWGGGGVWLDVPLWSRLVLSPSVGVGAYGQGNGVNLGSWVEFRSQAELAWQFDDRSRAAVSFYHISNAGITHRNPGTEALMFSYQLPIAGLFGGP